jgi:triphosphoribosyl-dephospho-CoA synthetase
MALTVTIGDRLADAASECADPRMLEDEEALEQKLEQALLEVEHLASGTTELEFELDGRTLHYAPSDELAELLDEQAERVDADVSAVLELHLELFARTFLPEDSVQPGAGPGAPVDPDDW